jgi:hypothetical protein
MQICRVNQGSIGNEFENRGLFGFIPNPQLILKDGEIEGFLERVVTHLALQLKLMFPENILEEGFK